MNIQCFDVLVAPSRILRSNGKFYNSVFCCPSCFCANRKWIVIGEFVFNYHWMRGIAKLPPMDFRDKLKSDLHLIIELHDSLKKHNVCHLLKLEHVALLSDKKKYRSGKQKDLFIYNRKF